ncbi:hypothetical protein B9R14_14090 [Acetivibrio saccincola]|uniref:Uncharacterized protein n=2 Tax=Acetivibrio saccincola TaxID=1677857 RepID=A0A2S8RDA8_9FIRM|nr:hypothetical protein B9R14_14090 [Acetivibrio saccincola]
MKNIPSKSFRNEIENNRVDSLNKKMYWESEPYNFNVIRWMCRLDSNGKEYGWTPVCKCQ